MTATPSQVPSPSSCPREPLSRRPLATLGTVFLLMMLIPLALYPLAPDEPLSVGDRVSANGKQSAYFEDPARYQPQGYTASCILEPHDRLIVLRMPQQTPPDQTVLARRDDDPGARPQFPFCPPNAEVRLHPHQVVKKERLSVLIKEAVERFGRK